VAFDKLKNLFNVDIKDGLKGSAVVQSASMPTPQARSYNATMWLDVQVEGRAPYRVRHECMVKAGKHPWPGTTLPVIVDRENPERIDVQWQDIQTIDERMAEGPGPAAAEQIRAALAGAGHAGAAPAGSGNVVEDRIASLERLSKLREAGVLSDAEFEAEKARVLAG
jgi:hypothetical protein